MSDIEGYLVAVVEFVQSQQAINQKYRGIDRLPESSYPNPWPKWIRNEESVTLEYMFGKYKDTNTGLISNLTDAVALKKKYQTASTRHFEILFCRREITSEENSLPSNYKLIGYDVAGESGLVSLVYAILPDASVASYLQHLNENGLFSNAEIAKSYLDCYRSAKLPDFSDPYYVWQIFIVDEE